MIFLYSYWLWIAALIVMAGLGIYFIGRHFRKKRITAFLSVREKEAAMRWPVERFRIYSAILITMGLACFCVALARPLTGPKKSEGTSHGIEAYIALDVSNSMLVQDASPYRLQFAKDKINHWREQLAGDRIGLILFAGDAFIQIPPTHDSVVFEKMVQNALPRSVGQGGTNFKGAIERAVESFERREVNAPILIIISDGEQLQEDGIAAARKAHLEHGLYIFTVGVGTAAGGEVRTLGSNGEISGPPRRDRMRNVIYSRLDEPILKAIAQEGGGRYVHLQESGNMLETLYHEDLRELALSSQEIVADDYNEWFFVPLALGLLLLLVEPFLRPRKPIVLQPLSALPVDLPEGSALSESEGALRASSDTGRLQSRLRSTNNRRS
ncbi:VWA domain-containing protein [Rubellicoccus peritrichatus]|uniref:VWA domain-containing protein n=1 Tax=Rubellicoccus peritrichatus TaxID=3080537 RepID=A0AAQ3LCM7_9BACT|nr:VWA domain-containing protein [Puniceicoccus sp. CR14]WOO43604.1 VWA domain-containing protein [Puniceicoccus sp. CR14]